MPSDVGAELGAAIGAALVTAFSGAWIAYRLLGALFVGQERLAGARALDPADVRTGDVAKLVAMLRQLERDVKKEG